MRDACFTLALLTWCGSDELSPSSELFLVGPGQNVTLPCSVRFKRKIDWLRQFSEEMITLTTTVKGNVDNSTVTEYHSDDNGHFETQEDNHRKSFSLKITGVTEADLGLYYCVAWESDEVRFGKGIRLIFPGSEGLRPSCQSCWFHLVTIPLIIVMVTVLCVCRLCHRRDESANLNRQEVCSPPAPVLRPQTSDQSELLRHEDDVTSVKFQAVPRAVLP